MVEPTDLSVSVESVSVTYRTEVSDMEPASRARKLADRVGHLVGRRQYTAVEALKGISFQVRRGESVGLVGTNGSGKSTLLRIIAGVEQPTQGRVLASTTPVLLGVNAALLPQLSGVSNVRIGLLALGFTPEEAKERTGEVVALSGIGDSIHRPMRTYSSGMGARLRFAIAAAADPEILLIDEALGTGDASFVQRSKDRMAELRAQAGTLFLVSHAPRAVEEICTRAVWLHQGEPILDGPSETVTAAYSSFSRRLAKGHNESAQRMLAAARRGEPEIE